MQNENNQLPISEEEIDQNLDGSFPASDPPSWNLGTDHVQMPLLKHGASLSSRPVNENDDIQAIDAAPLTRLRQTIKSAHFSFPAGLATVAGVLGLFVLAISNSAQTLPTIEAYQQSGIRRTNLLRDDLSVPGREILQVRVDFDPGVEFPRHRHAGEEIVFMIEGLLEYEVEGKPPAILKAGDVLFIPAGAAHRVTNVGRGNAAELATYIVEKGKPLITLVK